MAHHTSQPSDGASSVELADRSPPEPASIVGSRGPFQRQISFADGDAESRAAASHDVDHDSERVEGDRAEEIHGLGISESVESNKRDSRPADRPVGKIDTIRSSLRSSMPSPYLPGVQHERKASKPGSGVAPKEVPSDQSPVQSSPNSPYTPSADRQLLGSYHSRHSPKPEAPSFDCQTDGAIMEGRWSWLSVSIIVLAVYATAVSGIYLGIALARPRYRKNVGTDGHMSAATVSLLSTLFAKTVELSFVTVFVAFLGQVLSRRAFLAKARGGGVSIAEMMMRTWIMQPGTLIAHGSAVKYAVTSFLGVVSLTAAVMAMFYVTAAEALVSPKLRLGPWEERDLYGQVSASFANSTFLAESCATPIADEVDPEFKGSTCLQIEHAGQAYHNYELYLQGWSENIAKGNLTGVEYATRPPPVGVMFDNTTVRGQWIAPSGENVAVVAGGTVVQNLTMAMPHANVFNAARDSANDILQPDELNKGEGGYIIKASVPAPAVNVLCAGVEEEDISSLIYTEWPTNNGTFNASTWPEPPEDMISLPAYPNATAIDDLFDFGPEMGDARQRAPIFPKFPRPYNTLVNGTGVWPSHAIYLLAASPPNLDTSPYLFCSLKAMQYSGCTTRYEAANAGGHLSVHCDDDPDNSLPYKDSYPEAPAGGIWNPDWKDVASEWANSLSLGTGIADGNASNTRLLTQMIVESAEPPALNPALPSIGEALAVLSGCTLELSSLHSPFVHYWNYSADADLSREPQYQAFRASVRYQDYASGATEQWQSIFYVVLMAVLVTSCFCLVYLLWTIRDEGQMTDYTEPQNLFALAINSPPSRSFSGACGAGPEGSMLGKKWEVEMQPPADGNRGHPHFYVRCGDDDDDDDHHHHHHDGADNSRFRPPTTIRKRKSKLSMMSADDFEVAESPAVEQYKKLASRRKTLL